MKKLYLILFLAWFSINQIDAQCYNDWTRIIYPNAGTSFVGAVTLDGNIVSTNDTIGAFINGEPRAVKAVVISSGTAYISLNINSATSGETVNFKLWSVTACDSFDICTTIQTNIGGAVGTFTNPIPLEAYTKPTAGFNYNENIGTVTFTNTSQIGNSYLWDFGDGNTNTSTDPTHTYANNGTYTCCLITANNNCVYDTTCQSIVISNLNNPNPFNFATSIYSGYFLGQAQVQGVPADVADWIGAVDTNGVCVGATQIIISNGIGYFNLQIFGDEGSTTVDEGLISNEPFELVLWDASAGIYRPYPNISSKIQFSGWQNAFGAPLPQYNLPTIIYNFLEYINDTIPLVQGWNLVNIDVIPDDFTITSIFSVLIASGNLVYVTGFYDCQANFYDAATPFISSLVNIRKGYGIWVKVNNADTLIVTGRATSPTFRRSLDACWNLFGYTPQNLADLQSYFSSEIASSNLTYVTSYTSNGFIYFDPSNPLPIFSQLTQLDNSTGYWVKMQNAAAGQQRSEYSSNIFNFYWGTSNLSDYAGDSVSIYTKGGTHCGSMYINNQGYLLPVTMYGDDATTTLIEGITIGDELLFEFRGEVIDIGTVFYGSLEPIKVNLQFLGITKAVGVTKTIDEIVIRPNPFSHNLNISYNLEKASNVKIEILSSMGQEVRTVTNKYYLSGKHEFLWTPSNQTEGLYFIRFIIDNQTVVTRRILYMYP
jgi:PKD repeat protein